MSRRSIIVFLAVGVVAFMTVTGVVLTVLFAVRGGQAFGFGDRIALVEVEGMITDDAAVVRQLRQFRRDDSIKGFVVAINSPGGVVGAAQGIYRELRQIRDEDERPVVAAIGSVGASGGYYVALGADSIFALPGSITASIGAIMQFPDAGELLDRVGVDVEVVKSGEYKDIGLPFRSISAGDRDVLTELIEDIHDQFVGAVARERGLDPDRVRALADGRILSGRQAVDRGLVDGIGTRYDAVSVVGRLAGLGADPDVVRPRREGFSLVELLLGRATATALHAAIQSLGRIAEPQSSLFVPFYLVH